MTEDEIRELAALIIFHAGVAIANSKQGYDPDRNVTVDEITEMVREGIRQGYQLGKESKLSTLLGLNG